MNRPLVIAIVMLAIGTFPISGPSSSHAQDETVPEIYELTVANSKDQLLAYFSLANGYPEYISKAVESGIPTRYVYEVELETPRFLMDKTVGSRYVSRSLSFDSLKGEYRVSLGPDSPRVISVRTLEEVKTLMFEINDLPVVPLSRLEHGKTHLLRVRARAGRADSSLPFEGLMNLFSPWGFETEWHEIRFTY
jgi:hypothetical protein